MLKAGGTVDGPGFPEEGTLTSASALPLHSDRRKALEHHVADPTLWKLISV